ncbi:hypothetical protein SEA_JUMBO_102 [Gordonia phage Jumbo]|uniref:Uncharacterized protein n=1 Tax=Gordonia phage Jumbo TaxID=1887650 RepID=A0A1B3B0W8_9CAUD|nr:hypothetical protein BIZ69_gp102 [Gordonia phage Jumbo]AOE44616.1 hypothetical protein SEA_JUMBO_102 [Gordonia phage Jumbo]
MPRSAPPPHNAARIICAGLPTILLLLTHSSLTPHAEIHYTEIHTQKFTANTHTYPHSLPNTVQNVSGGFFSRCATQCPWYSRAPVPHSAPGIHVPYALSHTGGVSETGVAGSLLCAPCVCP